LEWPRSVPLPRSRMTKSPAPALLLPVIEHAFLGDCAADALSAFRLWSSVQMRSFHQNKNHRPEPLRGQALLSAGREKFFTLLLDLHFSSFITSRNLKNALLHSPSPPTTPVLSRALPAARERVCVRTQRTNVPSPWVVRESSNPLSPDAHRFPGKLPPYYFSLIGDALNNVSSSIEASSPFPLEGSRMLGIPLQSAAHFFVEVSPTVFFTPFYCRECVS